MSKKIKINNHNRGKADVTIKETFGNNMSLNDIQMRTLIECAAAHPDVKLKMDKLKMFRGVMAFTDPITFAMSGVRYTKTKTRNFLNAANFIISPLCIIINPINNSALRSLIRYCVNNDYFTEYEFFENTPAALDRVVTEGCNINIKYNMDKTEQTINNMKSTLEKMKTSNASEDDIKVQEEFIKAMEDELIQMKSSFKEA